MTTAFWSLPWFRGRGYRSGGRGASKPKSFWGALVLGFGDEKARRRLD
jgi:hypothetical protein